MDDAFKKYKMVLKYAQSLIDNIDCSCEYQHFGCSTMELRHGRKIINNLLKLEKLEDLDDSVLETGYEDYLYAYQYINTLTALENK